MEKYNVSGMSCAACVSRVEKAVKNVDGVDSVSVNLLTNSMMVEGSAKFSDIKKAVKAAGYGVSKQNESNQRAENLDISIKSQVIRLVTSIVLTLFLMCFSMLPMMIGDDFFPEFFINNHVAMGLAQLILASLVMIINQKFFVSGFKGIIHLSPNMDTLIAMGSGISYIWSCYMLFQMTYAQLHGGADAAMKYMDMLYFESAAMILALITVGKTLEAYSKGKTTNALKGLIALAPKEATIIKNGEEISISAQNVQVGDIFIVKSGQSIPVDGVVLSGDCYVDESALTGESMPVFKQSGSKVSSATILQSGYIQCKAEKVGQDTTISQIIKLVSDATSSKAPIAKIADKVASVFVPAVIGIAVVTFIAWMISGSGVSYSIERAVSVLVISCPCALGLATPVAIMVGSGVGAKKGILFKTAEALEMTGKVDIVALDKTGTISEGKPQVTDIFSTDGDENRLLSLAYSMESKSSHPLAQAIVDYAKEKGVEKTEIDSFEDLAGKGVKIEISGKIAFAGSFKFISSQCEVAADYAFMAQNWADEGKTPLLFMLDGQLIGIIAVADTIKKDSKKAVESLKSQGIHTIMLTGDNDRTAAAIAKQCCIDEVYSNVLPQDKQEIINQLKQKGKVAMIGDGINDAPALVSADIGIAIGAGSEIAIDSADVVLQKSTLMDAVAAITLSRGVIRNIKQNLFWAFCYNIIGIPLAAGLFIKPFGWELVTMFGAAAMSFSSIFVVLNALRLNLINVYAIKSKRKRKIINDEENKTMTMEIKVEGMMCPHCENAVKTALEAVDGIEQAQPSFQNSNVLLTISKEVKKSTIKREVEKAGYKLID